MRGRADLGSLRTVLHERYVTIQAPPVALYAAADAFSFPKISATSLTGDDVTVGVGAGSLFAGRWTLVGLAGSNFAQGMVDGWLTGVASEGDDTVAPPSGGGLQTRWLSLVEGAVLGWLRRPLLASMKRGVPAERHTRFLCRFGDDMSELRDALQMSNRYLGYVCLVDPKGSVRWHTHGNELPTDADLAALKALVDAAIRGDADGAATPEPKKKR